MHYHAAILPYILHLPERAIKSDKQGYTILHIDNCFCKYDHLLFKFISRQCHINPFNIAAHFTI